jgi:serine protease inhibitor
LPKGSIGLLATNQAQDQELIDLTVSSNKIAWQVWNKSIKGRSVEDNQVFSPLALTSALGISFLGARGSSAEAIDNALGLDSLTSRNPHLHLQQVAKDFDLSEHSQFGQSHTVYVDEKRGKVQDVFKARLDTLYGAITTNNLTEARQLVARDNLQQVAQDDELRSPFGIVSTATLNVS